VEQQLKAAEAENIKRLLKEILPDTRAYDGCLGVDVITNQDDGNNLVLVEKWKTRPQ
jgi:quinol monooxygenase YgiN